MKNINLLIQHKSNKGQYIKIFEVFDILLN